jgi:TonB family protein
MRQTSGILPLLLFGTLLAAQAAEQSRAGQPDQAAPGANTLAQVGFSQLKIKQRPEAPSYPPLARLANVHGTVTLRLTIDPLGRIEKAEALDGPLLLRSPAEAFFSQWLFEPVLIGGKPASVQCVLAMPFPPQAPVETPAIEAVVIQIEAAQAFRSVPVDVEVLRKETRAWLTRNGLKEIGKAGADPKRTLHLKVDVQTLKTPEGILAANLEERCSLLADFKLKENEPGKAPRIFTFRRFMGQRGEPGFQEGLSGTLQQTLQDLLTPGLANGGDQARVVDLDFSAIKVRKQAPALPYPTYAKERRIEGTVVLRVSIDPKGVPVRAEAVAGPAELFVHAIDYVLLWEFEPALVNGVPAAARFKMSFPFRIHDDLGGEAVIPRR